MRHAYETDAGTDVPPVAEAADEGFPTDGDPSAEIMPTAIGTRWAHAATSEIVNVILEGGLTPTAALGQLADAVDEMIDDEIATLNPGTAVMFASRNAHISSNPPSNRAANPLDSRFAIRSYLAARA